MAVGRMTDSPSSVLSSYHADIGDTSILPSTLIRVFTLRIAGEHPTTALCQLQHASSLPAVSLTRAAHIPHSLPSLISFVKRFFTYEHANISGKTNVQIIYLQSRLTFKKTTQINQVITYIAIP